MLDTTYARDARDKERRVYAADLSPAQWRALQVSYRIGDLLMPCCDAPAVPKESPLGLQFFAHAGGQCSTSPEGQWHQLGKEVVAVAARKLGIAAVIEHPSPDGWRADVWLDVAEAPAAIELQHSYQHLRDYQRRQARYRDAGVRCLWLLMEAPYQTLLKATLRKRWIESGRALPKNECGCIPDFPVAMLKLEDASGVFGPRLNASLHDVLDAFVTDRFVWRGGAWVIDT